ncbi:MAG: hypothetical protein WAO52_03235 [Prolixibacteraceae bacterium]
MRRTKFLVFTALVIAVFSCSNDKPGLNILNSKSFNGIQISMNEKLSSRLDRDTLTETQSTLPEGNDALIKLEELIATASEIKTTPNDSSWNKFSAKWEDFRNNKLSGTVLQNKLLMQKWTGLNVDLLKFSGEIRFGDAIENTLYTSPVPIITESGLKSVIYTHVFDKIFVNILGASSMNYQHTTGGTVKLIQETDFPERHEMTLRCELEDIRYMEVYIRIPSWAVNPTVTHGNVKYVPHPGEYCEISRKWKDGDEISVRLINPAP